ncbi:MAG: hypothetical protein WAM14_08035 [Candidatus Nitrosopolaris sp.]
MVAKISTYPQKSAEQTLKDALPNEFLISVISTKLMTTTEKTNEKTS